MRSKSKCFCTGRIMQTGVRLDLNARRHPRRGDGGGDGGVWLHWHWCRLYNGNPLWVCAWRQHFRAFLKVLLSSAAHSLARGQAKMTRIPWCVANRTNFETPYACLRCLCVLTKRATSNSPTNVGNVQNVTHVLTNESLRV